MNDVRDGTGVFGKYKSSKVKVLRYSMDDNSKDKIFFFDSESFHWTGSGVSKIPTSVHNFGNGSNWGPRYEIWGDESTVQGPTHGVYVLC